MRDDFSEDVKRITAARVGGLCSNPECRASTHGPQIDPAKAVNVGVAAHITAASPGGPRYNPGMSPEDRRSEDNCIWLCQNCAKLVDNDAIKYTAARLRQWKGCAEKYADGRVGKTQSAVSAGEPALTDEEQEVLRLAVTGKGDILILEAEQLGRWVGVGGRDLHDQDDPAIAAGYCDAVEGLLRHGLARHEGGNLFRLTGRGFRLGRELLKAWCPS